MSKVQWVGAVREFRTPACPPGYKLDPRRDKCVPVHQKLGEPTHPIIASAERAVALAGGPKIVRTLGAVETGENSSWRLTWSLLSMAGAGLAAYHGYKRNHESTGSAIGWGVLGALFPVITVPVALAQGYGKPKGASANPAEPFNEVGRIEHEGKVYEAGGAYYDRERGSLAGYPVVVNGGYALGRWDGSAITPLRLVKKYRGGFGRGTMWAWSTVYDGRVFSGRNGGPGMILRMRAGRSVK